MIELRYFEDIIKVEHEAINCRRDKTGRLPVESLQHKSNDQIKKSKDATSADAHRSKDKRTRPRPVPCNATGLAFSGGGIRSTAVCLGALQALHRHRKIASFDYLSTVSGGGYIGCCLSAAMSRRGGGEFPFGDDVFDCDAVAHLRNYSNYLMPRGRSFIRNLSDVVAIIIRGVLANLVFVLAALLGCALIMWAAMTYVAPMFPSDLQKSGFVFTLAFLAMLAVVLIIWAVLRSVRRLDAYTDDTDSVTLKTAGWLIGLTVIAACIESQWHALERAIHTHYPVVLLFIVFAIAISSLSAFFGRFLMASQHTKEWTTLVLRGATHLTVVLAAVVLPFMLWVAYLFLSDWIIKDYIPISSWLQAKLHRLVSGWPIFQDLTIAKLYLAAFSVLLLITFCLRANAYSLHRFYRDRLCKAFLFGHRWEGAEPECLGNLKLSGLKGGAGPYHIINAAMNVQGSAEANRRGRNADFFIFTPDFVGSDLTMFAPTSAHQASKVRMPAQRHGSCGRDAKTYGIEEIDPQLDVAAAMAISGAAVSANMGSATIRILSPTLAILNIRLGYWLRNPFHFGRSSPRPTGHFRRWTSWIDNLYLVPEMLNQLDETSRNVFLTDGGHIENLGVYELLKRGCQLIMVIDAEADPHMAFGSLIKLERYARIDFGIRIGLPYEKIASVTNSVSRSMVHGDQVSASEGPHCAVGRICYEDGTEGIIVYFKASVTGDERSYVLDYKQRNAAFPHETTADQFLSEEQFEAYRALGFHMVDRFFDGTDAFSFLSVGPGAFSGRAAAFSAIMAMMPQAKNKITPSEDIPSGQRIDDASRLKAAI